MYIYNIYYAVWCSVFTSSPKYRSVHTRTEHEKQLNTSHLNQQPIRSIQKPQKKKHQRTIKQAIYHDLPPKKWDFQTLCLFCLIFIPCGMSPPWLRVHGPPRRRPRASRAKAHGSRASVGRRANTTPELGPETCGTNDFCVEVLYI